MTYQTLHALLTVHDYPTERVIPAEAIFILFPPLIDETIIMIAAIENNGNIEAPFSGFLTNHLHGFTLLIFVGLVWFSAVLPVPSPSVTIKLPAEPFAEF